MTQQLTTETVVAAYATKAGAARCIKTADPVFYAGKTLAIRVRPNAEWARIGIDRDEFLVVALTEGDAS